MNRRTPIGTELETQGIPAYESVKSEYIKYLKLKGLNPRYMHDLTRDLPKLIGSPISDPQEITQLIEENKYRGALIRNYITFLITTGHISKEIGERFKAVIPRRKVGVDNFS